MLSEASQTEKDKYCMVSLIRGILKKQTKPKHIEKEMRFVVTRGEGLGEELHEGGPKVQSSSYKIPRDIM